MNDIIQFKLYLYIILSLELSTLWLFISEINKKFIIKFI